MERVGEHPVPAGPLAVRWLAYELERAARGRRVHARASARERRLGAVALARHGRACSSRTTGSIRSATRSCGTGTRTSLPRRRRAGRDGRARGRPCVAPRPPGELPPRVRPRRGAPLLVPGARIDAARSPRRRAAANRRAAAARRRARRARSRDWKPRSPPRTSRSSPTDAVAVAHLVAGARPGARLVAPAARRPRGGLRGGRRARSRRSPRARSAAGSPPGRRAADATRASASRCSFRPCSTGSSPRRHEGLPAYAGRDALFEGRAVVRLRSRSGRPSG